MSYAQISQKEARFLKKRVAELEQREERRFSAWCTSGYPGGISLGQRKLDTEDWFFGALKTARRLGCALVATVDDEGTLRYYAVQKKGAQ